MFKAVDLDRIAARRADGEDDFKSSHFCRLQALSRTPEKDRTLEPSLRQDLSKMQDEVILIEVGLRPHAPPFGIKRTIPSKSDANNTIVGHWLRTTIKLSEIIASFHAEEILEPEVEDEEEKVPTHNPKPKLQFTSKSLDLTDRPQGIRKPASAIDIALARIDSLELENDDSIVAETPAHTQRIWQPDGKVTDQSFRIQNPRFRVDSGLIVEKKFMPTYEIMGLEDELCVLPFAQGWMGHFNQSRMGISSSVYVRDFAHFVLQYWLPRPPVPKKPKPGSNNPSQDDGHDIGDKEDDDDEDDDTLIKAEDDNKSGAGKKTTKAPSLTQIFKELKIDREKPSLWAEYSNRSSIITHFVFNKVLNWKHVNPLRPKGTGDFNMLFTGDAFEAAEEKSIAQDRKFDLDSMFTTRKVNNFDLHAPDGNILSWLCNQRLLNTFRVDVLKIPHHSSSTTASQTFYRSVSASVYLISALASLHNHPRAEIIQAILATIQQEDGPAKPPTEYYRSNESAEEDKDSINKRPRPRLIFMTNGANYPLSALEAKAVSDAEDKAKESQKDTLKLNRALKMTAKRKEQITKQFPKDKPEAQKRIKQGELDDIAREKKYQDAINKEFERLLKLNEAVDPRDRLFKYGPFASDWLRTECPNNRIREGIPLVNARFFYQIKKHAATRLRFGRDDYRLIEVRCEWHKDDWVEMRYDWDDYDWTQVQKLPDTEFADYKKNWVRLVKQVENPYNDPLAYPYADDDGWEGGPNAKSKRPIPT